MMSQLKECIRVNFKFYLRSKLLLALACTLLFIFTLSSIPSMLFVTSSDKFEIIQSIVSNLTNFGYLLTATIAVLSISHHTRNRSLKMILTKPCPIELWLTSHFISALALTFLFCIFTLLVSSTLFLAWKIPFQWGLLAITADQFLQAIIIFAYLLALTAFFHPVLAILFALLFQEDIFKELIQFIAGGLRNQDPGVLKWILKGLYGICYSLYMILPSYEPGAQKLQGLYSSFRAEPAHWQQLLISASYAVVFAFCCFLISTFVLKKRQHI